MPPKSEMNLKRWLRLMSCWNFAPNEDTYSALEKAYSDKSRHYHSAEHINACLSQLDRCSSITSNLREVEIALWFHDAVYKPLSSDNERKSADWASSFLLKNGAEAGEIDRVDRLIMVTEHNSPAQTSDESILLDIDLSILGAKRKIYESFEEGVRREYKHVPSFIFNKKRAQILREFLVRDTIYRNEPFVSELELRAKENLENAISNLERKL